MFDNLPEDPPNRLTDKPVDASRSISGWMIILLWILILGGGTLFAQKWLENRERARAPSWTSNDSGNPVLSLQADRYGQYRVTGSANGQDITFLLDTGASEISIPGDVANQLNLTRGSRYPVITANGTIAVYGVILDEILIGPFRLEKVRAHINPSMEGEIALLGMSFLRHFELLQRAGELTISVP